MISLIQAASDGNTPAVKALLAQGTNINGSTPGGQTPLMLAAFFGRTDIVRLLLEAGADTDLKDGLGLSAMGWAERRGFSEVIELLANASPPGKVHPEPNTTEVQPPAKAEPDLPGSAADARVPPEQEVRSSPEELGRRKAELEGHSAATMPTTEHRQESAADTRATLEQQIQLSSTEKVEKIEADLEGPSAAAIQTMEDHPQSRAEARVTLEQEIQLRSTAEVGVKTDLDGPQATEAITTTEDLPPENGVIESSRSLDESGKTVEAEAPMEEPRGLVPERQSVQPSYQSATSPPRTSGPFNTSDLKVCPRCNTIYKSDLLAYCSYDAAPLLSANDAFFKSPPSPEFKPPAPPSFEWQTLWVLVAITVLGSAFFAYLLNNYVAVETPSAPAATQKEETANATKVSPKVGGALSGKEVNLPSPEYPAHLKSEGISGRVTVAVRVNKKGVVIAARALNGDPLLQAAAIEAAKKASFSPRKLAAYGEVVSGTITYTFK